MELEEHIELKVSELQEKGLTRGVIAVMLLAELKERLTPDLQRICDEDYSAESLKEYLGEEFEERTVGRDEDEARDIAANELIARMHLQIPDQIETCLKKYRTQIMAYEVDRNLN